MNKEYDYSGDNLNGLYYFLEGNNMMIKIK